MIATAACEARLPPEPVSDSTVEWMHYGGDLGGTKYSTAAEVHRGNVGHLRVAWRARAGDFPPHVFDPNGHRAGTRREAGTPVNRRVGASCGTCHSSQFRFESTPIMRDRTLYVSTPLNRVLALDPATGASRWTFDPKLDRSRPYAEGYTSRGVAAWTDTAPKANVACARRVFLTTVDARLVAVDGASGMACEDFGESGVVHLDRDAGLAGHEVEPNQYSVTSPPTVVGDIVVVGSAVGHNRGRDAASGAVHAFDARTGALRWAFDPIPRRATDQGWEKWRPSAARATGGANVWSIISADPERDLVFLPTGSAAPDYYGGDRPGRNDFANSVVALRASTGALVWSFQVVHHDLWDYDVAAQPMLITLRRPGGEVPAVVIGTKTGMIFVLNRETGEPLIPIEERAVPKSDVPGESAWPTQPFPLSPPLLLGTQLTADSAFGADSAERAYCRGQIARLRNEGIFTPPSFQGTLEWPGFWGGINWDGMAWDPERQRIITTVKRVAMVVQLHPRDDTNARSSPTSGREYLIQAGTPYAATRMPLVAPSGNPCTPPPWGSIVALDLVDASVRWARPLGTVPWLNQFPRHKEWGSILFGGPLVTAGGLAFVAASQDDMFRAFDTDDGKLLWEYPLPAGGQASPMTYVIDGRQYIVIAAGGRGWIGSPGDWIVAFALPK